MIRAHIVDERALAAITPDELGRYLHESGWRVDTRSESLLVWVLEREDLVAEIIQPLDEGGRDYPGQIAEALVTLADVEDRSELDVYRHMAPATWARYDAGPS